MHSFYWHRRCTLASKHENCLVPPGINLINPGIRMLRSLTPVAETGGLTEVRGRLGRTDIRDRPLVT